MRQHYWSNRSYPSLDDIALAAIEDMAKLDRATLRSICHTTWETRTV